MSEQDMDAQTKKNRKLISSVVKLQAEKKKVQDEILTIDSWIEDAKTDVRRVQAGIRRRLGKLNPVGLFSSSRRQNTLGTSS